MHSDLQQQLIALQALCGSAANDGSDGASLCGYQLGQMQNTLNYQHTHTPMSLNTHTCTHTHTRTHTHTYEPEHTHTHTHELEHTHAHTHTQPMSLNTHTHTTHELEHTHTHTHTYSHVYPSTHVTKNQRYKACVRNTVTHHRAQQVDNTSALHVQQPTAATHSAPSTVQRCAQRWERWCAIVWASAWPGAAASRPPHGSTLSS